MSALDIRADIPRYHKLLRRRAVLCTTWGLRTSAANALRLEEPVSFYERLLVAHAALSRRYSSEPKIGRFVRTAVTASGRLRGHAVVAESVAKAHESHLGAWLAAVELCSTVVRVVVGPQQEI